VKRTGGKAEVAAIGAKTEGAIARSNATTEGAVKVHEAAAATARVRGATSVATHQAKNTSNMEMYSWKQRQRQQQQMAKAAQGIGSDKRSSGIANHAIDLGSHAIPSSSGGSHGSFGMLFMSGIFAVFGMILLYDFLSHPAGASTFINTLRDSISSISQIKPLFTSTNTNKTPSGS